MSVAYIGEAVEQGDATESIISFEGAERYGSEDTSLLLNEELQSDVVANAILEAGSMGVHFGNEFSHIRTRGGVANYLLEAYVDVGADDVADFWEGNFNAA
jgi:hypothetical protein